MNDIDDDEKARKGREYQAFLVALGMAIVGWQYVETTVFVLYARLIRSQNPVAMSAMYHSIVNLQARLAMVDAAMKATLMLKERKALLAEWGRLLRRIKKASGRRNDFVHFELFDGKTIGSDKPSEPLLHSSVFDVREEKVREYTRKDIEEITTGFFALKSDLDVFQEKLRKVVPRPSIRKSRASKNRELFE